MSSLHSIYAACVMSSVEDQCTSSTESVVNERERKLQRRREKAKERRQTESAHECQERLRKRRIRDRARRAAQAGADLGVFPWFPETSQV